MEDAVTLFAVTELPAVVKVDPEKDSFESCVCLFERRARLVQGVTNVFRELSDLLPASALGDEELMLVWIRPSHIFVFTVRDQLLRLFLEAIGQSLQEQKSEDVVLVVRRV